MAERRIWDGDARVCVVGPGGKIYVGTEPRMVLLNDNGGGDWKRLSQMDDLPTRENWYFPPPPHQPQVQSIDVLPDAEGSVLVGIEVGDPAVSDDYGSSRREMNSGIHVDVQNVRPNSFLPSHLVADTDGGL